jgi:hypothetical protein
LILKFEISIQPLCTFGISCAIRVRKGDSTNDTTLQTKHFTMKHLAAYLLLGLGGNTSPSAGDVKGVLESVGIDADEERLEKLIDELKGKDLGEVRIYDGGL